MDKMSKDKTSTDKTSSDKRSMDKTSMDKTSINARGTKGRYVVIRLYMRIYFNHDISRKKKEFIIEI